MKCTRCGGTGEEPDNTWIGKQLSRDRKNYGITQTEMAKYLRISSAHLSDLEHGRRRWLPSLRDRYIKILEQYQLGEKK